MRKSRRSRSDTHGSKILIVHLLSIHYWSKEPSTLLLTGVKPSTATKRADKVQSFRTQ